MLGRHSWHVYFSLPGALITAVRRWGFLYVMRHVTLNGKCQTFFSVYNQRICVKFQLLEGVGVVNKRGVTDRISQRHAATLKAPRQADSMPAADSAGAIVDAAARCFARWGIPRTRVEDVAAEAGVSRTHIYRYFASKDAIVHAVVLREIHLHHRRLSERFPHKGPAADLIIGTLVSGILEASHDTYTKFLLSSDSARVTAHSIRSSPEIITRICAHWEPILEYARRRGELKEEIDIKDATQWLTFLEFSYIALPELIPDKNRLVHELKTFMIPALLQDRRPAKRTSQA